MALLFVGGLLLAVSLLLASVLGAQLSQALPGIATLLTILGIVIVAVRFGRSALAAPWGSASGIRHIAIAVGFLVLGVILEATSSSSSSPRRAIRAKCRSGCCTHSTTPCSSGS